MSKRPRLGQVPPDEEGAVSDQEEAGEGEGEESERAIQPPLKRAHRAHEARAALVHLLDDAERVGAPRLTTQRIPFRIREGFPDRPRFCKL